MKTLSRYAVSLFGAYAVAWTISYVLVFLSRGDGLDFRYFFEYFALAWTLRAGELPAFIWSLSFAAFLLFAPIVIFVVRRRSTEKSHHEKVSGDATPTI